jgi:hypothetical protein
MVRCLCTISSKNPSPILIKTVNNVKLFYPEFDIVVIDSDSSNFTYYELLSPDIKVEYCKNRNWELGAWYYAFKKYTDYDIYMFIQDGLVPLCRIPDFNTDNYEKGTVYSFHYHAMLWHGGYYEDLINIYKDTSLAFISELDPTTPIVGTAHTSFITNKENVYNILQLEEAYISKKIEKTKVHSWLSERCGGLIADKYNNRRINITPYFQKYSFGRDYL